MVRHSDRYSRYKDGQEGRVLDPPGAEGLVEMINSDN